MRKDCTTWSKRYLGQEKRRQPFFQMKWVRLMRIMAAAPRPVEYTEPATPMSMITTKT